MDESPKSVDTTDQSITVSSNIPNKLPLQKMVALALLLTVPVVMTGCGSSYDDDDDDDYYGGGGYIYSSGSSKNNSGYTSSGSSSNSTYKGFGSSGKSSVGG